MTGKALAMRLALERLGQRHAVRPAPVTPLPLVMASQTSMILEGFASTTDVDRSRQRFRKYAFGFPLRRPKNLPLLFRHDPNVVAGQIDDLEYSEDGELLIAATVDHPQARRCSAFSVIATIHEFEIRDADDPKKYHALITSADLDEISVTDRPANPHARVMLRYRTSAAAEQLDLIRQKVQCLSRVVTFIKEQTNAVSL